MKKIVAIAAMVTVVAGSVLAFLAFSDPGVTPKIKPESAPLSADAANDNSAAPEETPEQAAAAKMLRLTDASDRIDHLRWISAQSWARSNSPVLRTTIISDPDESVQIEAVEAALTLAKDEGMGATSNVVRTTLASSKGNTRARGLKAARENPDQNLVLALIELVDNRDPYATMALNALAYSDSVDGRAKILQVASDENADRKLRERAIALLAVTKDREAYPLLGQLANGEDDMYRKLADTVLKAYE